MSVYMPYTNTVGKPLTIAQQGPSQADSLRKQQMLDAWDAYNGKFRPQLIVRKNQPDDNVSINRCGPIVAKGASFLFGPVLKIVTQDASNTTQKAIDGIWGDEDDKMTLLSQLATNSGITGEAFIKIVLPMGSMKYPRLVILNPLLVRKVVAPDDCSFVLAYIIEYSTGDIQRKQVISRVDPNAVADEVDMQDLSETWLITNYKRFTSTGAWQQSGETDFWPYPFPPIFSCQNLPNPNESWGLPDLTPDIIEMNRVINFIKSNISRIIKYHAHPKTWASGIQASQLQTAVDQVICLPSSDSKIGNLEMSSDLHSSMNFVSSLFSDMDEQSRVPAVALGRITDLPRGNISGVALELLFQPLIEKTTIKRRLFGKLIREVTKACLIIAGTLSVEQWEDYQVNLQWPPMLPSDNLAEIQSALLLLEMGVSRDTLVAQLGYDSTAEAKKGGMVALPAKPAPPVVTAPTQAAA